MVCDQFVDRANGRDDTFFDGLWGRVGSAKIYDPTLRQLAIDVIREHRSPSTNGARWS